MGRIAIKVAHDNDQCQSECNQLVVAPVALVCLGSLAM